MLVAIITSVIIFFVTYVIYHVTTFYIKWRRLPPGPFPLPGVGNALSLQPDLFHLQVQEMSKKYGKVFTLMMGSTPYIIVSDYNIGKELYVKRAEDMSERPVEWLSTVFWESRGLFGKHWKLHKNFTLQTLRQLGLGKGVMEERIKESLQRLIERIDKIQGKEYDFQDIVYRTTTNFTTSVFFDAIYSYEDKTIEKLLAYIYHIFVTINPLLGSFMWVHKIPGDPFQYGKVLDEKKWLLEFCKSHFDKREEVFDGENIDTFVDALIAKMRQETDKDDGAFNLEESLNLCLVLVFGGIDTTTWTLLWGLLYLALHPDVQDKARDEIWGVLGHETFASTKQRHLLPYTDSVISEFSRLKPAVPLSLAHNCAKDNYINQLYFPKNSSVLLNLYGICHDEETFQDPDNFMPDKHFYDEQKSQCRRIDQLVHFSIGRRDCVGQELAKAEMFLFFVSLIQRFEWTLPTGPDGQCEKPDLTGITSGLVMKTGPVKLIATPCKAK